MIVILEPFWRSCELISVIYYMRPGSGGTLAAHNRYYLTYDHALGAFFEFMGAYNHVYVKYDCDN